MKVSPSLISLVARSKRRKNILKTLTKRSMTQAELRKFTGMYKSHTSRTISELLKNKLIICLNPKDRAFKFYKTTKLGINVIKEVERIINI